MIFFIIYALPDYEDEGTESDEQVGCLVNHSRLHELPQQGAGILLLRGVERVGGADVDVQLDECFFADSYPGSHNQNSSRNHLSWGSVI